MYQLIIFDWDGTLMDSANKISNCIIASARDVGLPEPTPEHAKSIIGLGLNEAMLQLFPTQSNAKLNQMVEAYRYHFVSGDVTEQRFFEGVDEGLAQLNKLGALLAVATGKSRAGLDRVFAESQIGQHFSVTRCADETRSKPHPQMLEEVLDITAISPDKAIMVGDTTYDMDMAANAAMHGLGAAYGVHSEAQLRASKAIDVKYSFCELLDWLCSSRVEAAYV